MSNQSNKIIYAFIDASNLFYGGKKNLGWSLDYKKLLRYLEDKYKVKKAFYYAGVELHNFKYSVLEDQPIDIDKLLDYLSVQLKNKSLTDTELLLLDRHIQRVKFYRKLQKFGYILKLKPVKTFIDDKGSPVKKANCDVDMCFDMMYLLNQYSGAVALSGDGDFVVVLKYLKSLKKDVIVLARRERTAREIRQLVNGNFRDFHRLQSRLMFISAQN